MKHRDPQYFPDPEGSPPSVGGRALNRLPKYAYYPFAWRGFALATIRTIEAAIVLATVGQIFRFTVDQDAVVDIKPQITLLPKYGTPATLQLR